MFGISIFGVEPFGDAPLAVVYVPVDPTVWRWCAMPGVLINADMRVSEMRGIDGYTDRRTRGLNQTRHAWELRFPFTTPDEQKSMHDFLLANCLAGFWFTPPGRSQRLWVTCDTWGAATLNSRRDGGVTGELQATFVRSFTPLET